MGYSCITCQIVSTLDGGGWLLWDNSMRWALGVPVMCNPHTKVSRLSFSWMTLVVQCRCRKFGGYAAVRHQFVYLGCSNQ